MRDIDKYTDDYVGIELKEFEAYQVKYRRRLVLEQIEKYRPKKILEIGCGMEPLFCYVKNADFTIIEPSEYFCQNAKKLAGGGKGIMYRFYRDFLKKLNVMKSMI